MKILFIGNSYTYFNDMPSMFVGICRKNLINDISAEKITSGGYSLRSYLDTTDIYGYEIEKRLKAGGYDYVVVQEQSVRPAKQPELFYGSARLLCEKIRKSGAEPVFYETWGRRDGSAALTKQGWTHEKMQSLLRTAYRNAAEYENAGIVYAGEKIHEAYRGADGDNVYCADGSHPSPRGSEIIAGAFYSYFSDKLLNN